MASTPPAPPIRWTAPALFLPPALACLLLRGPWPMDETRLLQVAAEMEAAGAWLVPTLLGEPYTHKPPLILWAIRLLSLAGVDLWLASRLLTLLAALGCLLFLDRAARALDPARGAAVAPALAVSPFFLLLGQAGTYDVPLLCLLLGAAASICVKPNSWLLPALFAGGALLAKGHVALLFILPWLLALRLALLGRGALRPTWRTPAAAALCLGLVAAWFVPFTLAAGADRGREALLDQLLGRLGSGAELGHERPFHYYFVALPLLFLPWSWILVRGLVRTGTAPWTAWEKSVLWVAAGQLLVLACVGTKGAHYALPLLPWLLLLLPRALEALGGAGSQAWVWAAPGLGLGALLLAAGPCDGLLGLIRPGLPELLAGARLPAGLGGVGLLALPLLRNRLDPLPLLALAELLAVLALVPLLDRAQLPHAILEELSERPPRALLVFHERAGGSLSFLAARAGVAPPEPGLMPRLPPGEPPILGLGRPGVAAPSLVLEKPSEERRLLAAFLLQKGTRALLRRKFWEQMELGLATRVRIVRSAYFRGSEILLLSGPNP